MSQASDRVYFPPLDGCLSGERVLLSWKLIATALSDTSGQRQQSAAVTQFLNDSYVHSLFSNPEQVFSPASDSTKTDFETKTAPIHVTAEVTSRCDVNILKADAQWLSKVAQINLVAALRITIVEFQSRASKHLIEPLSSHDAANLQEAAGLNSAQISILLSDWGVAAADDADQIWSHFEKEETRRTRCFMAYLSERRNFAKATDLIHSLQNYGTLPFWISGNIDASTLPQLPAPTKGDDGENTAIATYLDALSNTLSPLDKGFTSVTDESFLLTGLVQLDWMKTVLTEAVHEISIIFQLIDNVETAFTSSQTVNQWFAIMDTFKFFEIIDPIHDTVHEILRPLKTMAVVVSLAFLRPARSLLYLAEREDDTSQGDDVYDAYVLSSDVLEQIHTAITNSVNLSPLIASPVVFAWTVVLQRMLVSYHNRKEKSDELQGQNARDTFESGVRLTIEPGAESRTSMARRNSAGSIFSIESSKFDGFLINTLGAKEKERSPPIVENLANLALTEGKAFECLTSMADILGSSVSGGLSPLVGARARTQFLELLKVSYLFVGYHEEPMNALLATLSATSPCWNPAYPGSKLATCDPLATMLQDEHLMEQYYHQAASRFPFEFTPFISFSQVLCRASTGPEDDKSNLVYDLLRQTPTLTFVLPETFRDYEIALEDDNTNSFRLTADCPLLTYSSTWKRRHVEEDGICIPAGTFGRFLTDSGDLVQMEYHHSTLALLGRHLELYLSQEPHSEELGRLSAADVADSISLLTTLVRIQTQKSQAKPDSTTLVRWDDDVLQEASKYIGNGKDIISIVCEIMDVSMQDELATAGDSAAIVVLTSCVQFLDATLPLNPSRVWSYMARSDLLSSEARAGKITKITGSLDLVAERFEFLSASVSLFSDLVNTAISSAMQRRVGVQEPNRRRGATNLWAGISEKVMASVTLSIAQVVVDIFENTSTWRYQSNMARVALLDKVIPIMNRLVVCTHAMGPLQDTDCLTSCLRPAAAHVIDCFLSRAEGTLRFQPLLESFVSAFALPDTTLYSVCTTTIQSQLVATIDFCTSLLRAASLLEMSSNHIQTYLFKISTLLARLCGLSDYYREPTMWLLNSLVVNAGHATGEPPSFLGYLGPPISKSFLQVLSDLGKPFEITSAVRAVWQFFSSILRNRQQWMSNCLLTGQTPREAMRKDRKANESSPHSVFSTALGKIKNLKDLDSDEALTILTFVAAAQNFWPWTVFTLQKEHTYLAGLQAYVRELKPSQISSKSSVVKASKEARIAAYAAEIFSMQLYHSRHLGNVGSLAKDLVSDIDYYLREGVDVAGYNKSLHTNFARNFTKKYYGCSVESFKRTMFRPKSMGFNYYYDVDCADEMLKYDPAWLGSKQNGFKMEMELANGNLSLVDAQIALFHAWEFLLVELSVCLKGNDTINRQMLQVARQCLDANQTVPGPEAIFMKIVSARADLALVLVQRLANSTIPINDVEQLLGAIVGTINDIQEPFSSESITYFRTLLKALFVTLRLYTNNDHKVADGPSGNDGNDVGVTQLVLNVLDRVVARGFRSLVSLVHETQSEVAPEDLSLLTAVLQACLSLPNLDQSQTQILNIMASHDCIHAATSLFSWADKLSQRGDPIYGELSMLFLLELSNLPLIAEQLACDGVLSNLLSTNLIKYMLNSKLSPYADITVSQRCYSIWTKGLLPLMLNLLTALGATVAPEVSYVLNQFGHLLNASIDRFEAPSANRNHNSKAPQYITLLATSEIHSLALLTRILAALRVNNTRDIPEVEWESTALLENVEYWISSKKLLKERLMPLGSREVEWRGIKREAIESGGCDNLLEEKVLAQLEAVRDVLSEELETT